MVNDAGAKIAAETSSMNEQPPAASSSSSLGQVGRSIQQLLAKLLTLQIGSASANTFIRAHEPDRRALGGVQSAIDDPVLRIDVTQHQTHAIMQALELVKDRKTKEPAPEATTQVMERARQNGLLIGKGGLYGNVLRLAPMLNTSKSDVDEAIRLLDKSFSEAKL